MLDVEMYWHNCPHPVLSSCIYSCPGVTVTCRGRGGEDTPPPPLIYVDHRWRQQPVLLPPCPHHYQLPWYAVLIIEVYEIMYVYVVALIT
jgi:hypothetical protein